MAYTYLIGWSKHNLWYYGVRYAKGCTPSDLWVKYFTSSKEIKKIRSVIGEPDIIQVRKTFEDKSKAIAWELKVLRRMRVVERTDFINKHDKAAPPINRMFGKDNPQSDPKWKEAKRKRAISRAIENKQKGLNACGNAMRKDPVLRTCPVCGDVKIYKTYRIHEIENIKNRLCKSCAATARNRRRHADGFYERLKHPHSKLN